ncbi:hypothetical protein BEN47_05090 [Hymenobacter lapidarius]|uniref:Bacteriophage tail tape measure N-terminal domain-containing protein n=1 Tax=Hymenobacter lapidarius TaxID=1908237 RepID=A0A1G1STN1_9BACT|nr:hypothetical protein [Hymenobacter lapidarius]OGX81997.1 hypothetical protein BEN47_05090 [Hymenobacter lapidarius]
MADPQNTIILSIKLSEGDTEEKLQQVVLAIEATKKAQATLTSERKAGTLADADFAKQTVELANKLTLQRAQQRDLTKDLTLYRTAVNGVEGSYQSAQAALSLAQRQYQVLAGSADNSTESTQALSEVIDGLRNTLKKTDADQSLFIRQVGGYPGAFDEASTAVKAYANNLIGLKQQLEDLTASRATADVGTAQFEELNRAILDTRTAIQQAEGKIDEFGDRVQKNSRKEDIDTLGDAFGGVTAAIQLSSLAMDDQEDAAQVTAKATQFLANAEAVRTLQIGLANAQDAVAIGLQKVRNLLFTEQATVTAAASAATVTQTGATVVQTTATGGATIAQRALNLAMTLNPIGLVVVAVGALVGAYFAWRGASDATQKKVKDITETVLRFGTPIGLIITGFEKLSEKSETVRRVLGSLGEAFDFVAGKVATVGREAGEAIGLLDTAAEKAAKASANAVENSEKEIISYQLRAREVEKAGAAIEQYRSTEREGFAKNLEALRIDNAAQNASRAEALVTIDAKKAANEKLSKSEQKFFDERREREQKIAAAQLALSDFEQATQDQVEARQKASAAARKKELDDAATAGERAKKLAEQNLKDEFASRAKVLENRQQQITRALELTKEGSAEELRLLREQARNATAIQLATNSGAQVGLAKKEAAALVAARKEILANGQATELKAVSAFAQRRAVAAFQASLDNLSTELAGVQAGSNEEVRIKQESIRQQLALDLAGTDERKDLKGREAQENRLRAEATQKLADLEYQQSLRNLENYFADVAQRLEADHANGRLSDKKYQDALLANQQTRVEAAKVLNQDYNRSTAELNREGAALDAQATANYKSEIQERIAAGQQFGAQTGQLFADLLTEQGATLESFVGNVLILLLDVLEKQMLATVASSVFTATAGSVASPQSILTGGVAGFAQAALLTAAITAAFAVGKGVIKATIAAPPKSQFAQGTVLGGASHAEGGTQLYGRNGHWFGEAEAGEAVINKRSTALFLPLLSQINQAGGGRALFPYSVGTARMAIGGMTAPLMRDSLGGVPVIDYARLAQAVGQEMSKVKIYTKTQETIASMDKIKYTQSLANS